MKQIIYFNDTGFPYAVLAAAVRSGELPAQRPPERDELERILRRCGLGKGDATVYHLGYGSRGEKCLALWSQGNGDMIRRTVQSFLGLFQIHDYELVQLPHRKTPLLTLGVWLTKVPGLRSCGLGLIHRQLKTIYWGRP